MRYILLMLLLIALPFEASEKILNIYSWSGYFPQSVIDLFYKETGIRVHWNGYDSNEMLLERLKYFYKSYDIIVPSGYILDRLIQSGALSEIKTAKIPASKALDDKFYNYKLPKQYSVPYLVSVTGMLINTKYHPKYQHWEDFWNPQCRHQLLLLDDMREVFSIASLTLAHSPNTLQPQEIKEAYQKLRKIKSNIKAFSNDLIAQLYANEELTIGMSWNGDAKKAMKHNPHLSFIYPKEGFIISVDHLAIPKEAPHKEEAYAFINFLLRPDISVKIVEETGYLLPHNDLRHINGKNLWEEVLLSLDKDILKHGILQTDVNTSRNVYIYYWEKLRMGL